MQSEPIVTIKHGSLRGQEEQTKGGFLFYSFQGIPFAKAPVGPLRFKAPQEATSWKGIRDATQEGESCFCRDMLFGTTGGSEDCLFLNVYTPTLPKSKGTLKPVMVWIHGGGFVSGTGNRTRHGPEFLIDNDIVLVTINYRLGAFGFLSIPGVCANAGLKDQVLALKWVQENIKSFNGNPGNVTIFGESAGAGAVGLLLVSPMAKGLFHKAILQSGCGSCPWVKGSHTAAHEMAKVLGLKVKEDALLDVLQSASKEDILEAQTTLGEAWKPSVQRWLSPVVEDSDSAEERFLPDEPINLIKAGNYNKVPVIIGSTSGEGIFILSLEKMAKTSLRPTSDEDHIPIKFKLEKGSKQSKEIGAKIVDFYYGQMKENPNEYPTDLWIKYMSDAYFNRDALDTVENILKTSSENVFLYKFNMNTKLNVFAAFLEIEGEGVCHAEDVFYLFKSDMTPEFEENSEEDIAMQRMTKWWTNFAKYSDPNDNDGAVKWPKADLKDMQYMHIDTKPEAKEKLDGKMNDFWKSIEAQAITK